MAEEADSPEALKKELYGAALDAYRSDYAGLADQWVRLETKAQATITVAGIFLAAVFASARGDAAPALLLDRWLLGVSIVLLVLSVAGAGLALRVQTVHAGPPGDEIERFARLAIASAGPRSPDELRVGFLVEQSKTWAACTRELRKKNGDKAELVRGAQGLLVLGIGLALVVTSRSLALTA
jgi:hypothetical protein